MISGAIFNPVSGLISVWSSGGVGTIEIKIEGFTEWGLGGTYPVPPERRDGRIVMIYLRTSTGQESITSVQLGTPSATSPVGSTPVVSNPPTTVIAPVIQPVSTSPVVPIPASPMFPNTPRRPYPFCHQFGFLSLLQSQSHRLRRFRCPQHHRSIPTHHQHLIVRPYCLRGGCLTFWEDSARWW